MRSLFLKIFLWFWISIILISLTMVLIAAIAQSNSENAAWQNQAIVASEAAHAVDIYEREGADALRKHFERLPKRPIYAYLLDEHGTEVLGQKIPQQAVQTVHKGFLPSLMTGPGMKIELNKDIASAPVPLKADRKPLRTYSLAAPPTFDRDTPLKQVMATYVLGPSGRQYVFMVVVPPFSIKTFLTSMHLDLLAKLGAALVLVGLFCFWLARHITAPVVQLREAASRIADGQLNTRVSPAMQNRRDEIGVLGQHFDRMAERIESLVAAQQRLLSTVSHELRSPLARLSLAAGLLRQCPPVEMQEYLDRIEFETDQLDKLIAQLLTLSKIESGANTGPPKERIDLPALLQEIAANGNFEARARCCSVFVGPVDACATTGVVDQIRRAIENVVRNAIRYTRANSQVEITLRKRGELSTATGLIRVRDYGPGVPDSDLAKIFLPFYRVHSENESHGDGCGLGLAITEGIVRWHGGRVHAANAPEGGLIVDLELPLSA